ncbi:hypothetical protein [Streptomyces sp. SP2-10]|uniref:hypothetical protein n=1 Tax=Streptomyces sp. SP2-10 TaxID=2873385 RepID=UPI001CA6622D|nr:hypothetical protein [Streptomyces sp. SP2-10]MBY8842913.1 hypothetical protein [Streptomyces sp. SP2-10]
MVSAVLALSAALTGGTAQAQETLSTRAAQPPAEHACVFEGVDLNEFLGVPQRLIGPPPCREAFVGEKWVRTFPAWVTAASAKGAVYPPGYKPARRAPMDDFVSKFRGIRVVNDIGTAQERSYVFTGKQVLRRVDLDSEANVRIASFATPPLHPLSAGAHTTTVFMRLSAQHCDGLGTDPDANCLPGGEFEYTGDTPVTFFPRSTD